MALEIKFGTDGWRAAIAKEFTVENVARIAQGTANWVAAQQLPLVAVVGHDCRFGGPMFAETVAKVFLQNGFEVHLAEGPVTTPMVSLGAKELNTGIGVIITASHNPPSDNGFKLKGNHGGPLLEADVKAVEKHIPDEYGYELDAIDLDSYRETGKLKTAELEDLFVAKVEANFDLDAIRNSGLEFAYDAMYGSGQFVMRRLFPDITLVHCEHNPLFDGVYLGSLVGWQGRRSVQLHLVAIIRVAVVFQHGPHQCSSAQAPGGAVLHHHPGLEPCGAESQPVCRWHRSGDQRFGHQRSAQRSTRLLPAHHS